mgnify:CR=1 FL=1
MQKKEHTKKIAKKMMTPAHIYQPADTVGFQHQQYRADKFKKGYEDAMMLDSASQLKHKGDPTYMNGWNNGTVTLNNSIPLTVHHMLQLVLAHAHSDIDSRITMITPPLSSFSRRSVHLFLGPVRDKVEVLVKGRKCDHHRRFEIRYPLNVSKLSPSQGGEGSEKSQASSSESKVVRILQHQDNESSILDTKTPEGA